MIPRRHRCHPMSLLRETAHRVLGWALPYCRALESGPDPPTCPSPAIRELVGDSRRARTYYRVGFAGNESRPTLPSAGPHTRARNPPASRSRKPPTAGTLSAAGSNATYVRTKVCRLRPAASALALRERPAPPCEDARYEIARMRFHGLCSRPMGGGQISQRLRPGESRSPEPRSQEPGARSSDGDARRVAPRLAASGLPPSAPSDPSLDPRASVALVRARPTRTLSRRPAPDAKGAAYPAPLTQSAPLVPSMLHAAALQRSRC